MSNHKVDKYPLTAGVGAGFSLGLSMVFGSIFYFYFLFYFTDLFVVLPRLGKGNSQHMCPYILKSILSSVSLLVSVRYTLGTR